MPHPAPVVIPDEAMLFDAAARVVRDVGAKAISDHGDFRVAFPGGRTARALLERLAGEPFRTQIEWGRVMVLFADERAVPPDHAESNYRLVREALLDPLGAEAPLTRRMAADSPDLGQAARDYALELERPLDLVVLGVGEDGHIASLFPGSPLLLASEARVGAVFDSPKPPARRLTLLPRALAEALSVLVLATGAAKAGAVAAACAEEGDISTCPARLVRSAAWLLDIAAAAVVDGGDSAR
ncbi:MAG: 6-phosphogluconolactonase [Candidatus Eisenbacteria bacterium]